MKTLPKARVGALALLLLTAFHSFAQSPAPKPPGRLVDVGGYRLHLNCTGRGRPAVVLIAGAGDFSSDWALVQSRASSYALVCSYDRAGLAVERPRPHAAHHAAGRARVAHAARRSANRRR